MGNNYSETSNNRPSEKRTTAVQRTTHLLPIDFTIKLIHYEPPRRGHLNSEQRTLISPRCTFIANTKLPPKTDSEATPTKCGRLSTAFVMLPSLDSKTENYTRCKYSQCMPRAHLYDLWTNTCGLVGVVRAFEIGSGTDVFFFLDALST